MNLSIAATRPGSKSSTKMVSAMRGSKHLKLHRPKKVLNATMVPRTFKVSASSTSPLVWRYTSMAPTIGMMHTNCCRPATKKRRCPRRTRWAQQRNPQKRHMGNLANKFTGSLGRLSKMCCWLPLRRKRSSTIFTIAKDNWAIRRKDRIPSAPGTSICAAPVTEKKAGTSSSWMTRSARGPKDISSSWCPSPCSLAALKWLRMWKAEIVQVQIAQKMPKHQITASTVGGSSYM
mmetsp:Transcript_25368/g.60358  ORF Transcript_25368/g.60358 Transcript_25368/m.60358 type:complete len:233 (-) Transcript_25368:114-812(-)